MIMNCTFFGHRDAPKEIEHQLQTVIEKSDFVVAYVSRPFGGAANFYEISKRKNKTVINTYKDI